MDSELRKIDKQKIVKGVQEAYGEKPIDVHAQNVVRTMYYKDYLYRLVCGTWDVGMNDIGWNLDYLKQCLFIYGGFAVSKYKGAIVMYPFSVQTRTIAHLPREISSNDGDIDAFRRFVGENAEIVTLGYKDITCAMWNYAPVIDIYGEKLSNCDASIDINLINCRTPFLFECYDKQEAEDMKALYTRIANGNPAVYWRGKKHTKDKLNLDSRPLNITTLPVKENYIADKIFDAKRSIVAEFLTMIGVDNVDYEKKERLVSGEIDVNNDMIRDVIDLWRGNVEKGCERVNAMFDIGLNIRFKSASNVSRETSTDSEVDV